MEGLQAIVYLNNSACTLAAKGCLDEAIAVQTDTIRVVQALSRPWQEETLAPKLMKCGRMLARAEDRDVSEAVIVRRSSDMIMNATTKLELVQLDEDCYGCQHDHNASDLCCMASVVIYNQGCLLILQNRPQAQRLFSCANELLREAYHECHPPRLVFLVNKMMLRQDNTSIEGLPVHCAPAA